MIPASYSVIRFVPDQARNEPRNVGILLWSAAGSTVELDSEAITRVVRDHPHLAEDALAYLEPDLRERLGKADWNPDWTSEEFERFLRKTSLFPVVLSEARYTTLTESTAEAVQATVRRLVGRIVKPPRRGGGAADTFEARLVRRWQPLLQNRLMIRDFAFQRTRTGNPRVVDFFANHGANIAIDTIGLAIKDAKRITERADAEAFKIQDIVHDNEVRFIAVCSFRSEEQYATVNAAATRSLETAGARVVTIEEEVGELVEREIGVQQVSLPSADDLSERDTALPRAIQ